MLEAELYQTIWVYKIPSERRHLTFSTTLPVVRVKVAAHNLTMLNHVQMHVQMHLKIMIKCDL